MSRPEHKPTKETRIKVDALSSCGIPHTKIARYLGIAENTLKKHYPHELEFAKIDKVAQVANSLFFKAIEGNVPAMIWFLRTQGKEFGWTEAIEDKHDEELEKVGKIKLEIIK